MESAKKLSIAHCKKILESSGKKYSDEETEKIRDLLYMLGELDYRIYIEVNRNGNSTGEQNKAA
jgi:hypothetical protein